MSNPATKTIDRQTAVENTTAVNQMPRGFGGGYSDTAGTLNGPQNANAEAAPPATGPKTPPGVGSGAKSGHGFLTAAGQYDSHAVTLADGTTNKSPRAGKPYDRITWRDILQLVRTPAARPKDRAHLVVLSSYVEHDGRTHDVQRQRGVFGGLAVDIDTGNPTLAEVVAALRAAVGDVCAAVYSSSSATPDKRKWRILIPLSTSVAGADYADTETALFGLLEAHGLKCDPALARTAQPVFLPNVPPAKRGRDGAPLFYQSQIVVGPVLELDATHPVVVARDAMRAQREAEAAEAAKRAAEKRAERLAYTQATGDDFDPIAHFNEHHTVADMLTRYGFERSPRQRGSHWKSPLSESGSYGTEDRGNHWVAVSAWAQNHNVGRPTAKGFRAGDAFDLFAAFEHGGDRSAAVRAYAAEVRPARTSTRKPAPEPTPPVRVENAPHREVATLDQLRGDMREDMAHAIDAKSKLVVVTPDPGVGKTTAAIEMLVGRFDKITWVVGTHENATDTVARIHEAGHTDAAAIPPRDATTCRCWTAEDAAQLREEYPGHPYVLPMVDAIKVGNAHMACLACPLSGLSKQRQAPAPEPAFAGMDAGIWEAFTGEAAETTVLPVVDLEHDRCSCEYLKRKREAEAARVTVLCLPRYQKSGVPPATAGTTQATVIDEHGTDALMPYEQFTLAIMRATRDAMATAVDNWRNRKNAMRWTNARQVEHELLGFGEALVGVANKLVEHMEQLEAAGVRAVSQLPPLQLAQTEIPKRAHTKLARLLAQAGVPDDFKPEAMDVVRKVATGQLGAHAVYVEPLAGGGAHVQLTVHHARHNFDGTPTYVFDANADLSAIRRRFPGVVEITPRGAAPLAVEAEHWWQEINPSTHPAVVVRFLEMAIHEKGFKRAGVMLCKKHRDVLFPTTKPRGGKLPQDKEPDPQRIADWTGRGSRQPAESTAEQRMARAVALVERVRQLRRFIARDEHGRLLVEHHGGTASRGSNKFIAETDGFVVVGHTRVNPGEIAAYMLGTGRGDAVAKSDGNWGDVEGELPAVGGGTTKRRWRGYGCPEWAEAARQKNRGSLLQATYRGRPTLDTGVSVVLVAAEPVGLPVRDPPATVPDGVAAVVAAVRELAGGTKVVPPCEDGQPVDGAESMRHTSIRDGMRAGVPIGQTSIGNAKTDGVDGGESRQTSIGINRSPIFLGKWRDSQQATLIEIERIVGAPRRSVERWLADAVKRGLLVRTGAARATRYALPGAVPAPLAAVDLEHVDATTPAMAPQPPDDAPRVLRRLCEEAARREHPKTTMFFVAPEDGAHPQLSTTPPNVHFTAEATNGAINSGAAVAGRTTTPTGSGPGGSGGGGGERTPEIPPRLAGPAPGGRRIAGIRAQAETHDGGRSGTNASQKRGHETIPHVLAPGGSGRVSGQPDRIRGPQIVVLSGLLDPPTGPFGADPLLLALPPPTGPGP